jgi:hypothetical protein
MTVSSKHFRPAGFISPCLAHQALRMPSSTAVFNQLSTTISYLEGTAESASLILMRLRSRVPLEG